MSKKQPGDGGEFLPGGVVPHEYAPAAGAQIPSSITISRSISVVLKPRAIG
jgi:hypothetical protein